MRLCTARYVNILADCIYLPSPLIQQCSCRSRIACWEGNVRLFFVFLKLFGQCSSTNIPGAICFGQKYSSEGFYLLQLHVGPRNPKRAKRFGAQIIFLAMKLIVFTKFQGMNFNYGVAWCPYHIRAGTL